MRGRPKKSRHRSVRLPERFGLPADFVRAQALHLRHSLKSSPEFSPPPVCLCRACAVAALRTNRFAVRASASAFRRPHRNIDSATIRPDAASINNYFAQRYALPPQCSVAPAKGGVLAVVARCLRTGSGRGARVRLGRRKRQSQGKRSP